MAYELLKSQRNEVFQAILQAGLDPGDFEFSTEAADDVLVHVPTGFYFHFQANHRCEYRPGSDRPVRSQNAGSWPHIVSYVQQWLQNVRRETEQPDLWEELSREGRALIEPATEVENTPFDKAERGQIAIQLREIRELVATSHNLDIEQQKAIAARFDYLEEASTRLGRVDWRSAFLGSVISLAMEAVIPVEAVRQILNLASRGLGYLFGVELPELPSAG